MTTYTYLIFNGNDGFCPRSICIPDEYIEGKLKYHIDKIVSESTYDKDAYIYNIYDTYVKLSNAVRRRQPYTREIDEIARKLEFYANDSIFRGSLDIDCGSEFNNNGDWHKNSILDYLRGEKYFTSPEYEQEFGKIIISKTLIINHIETE